MKELKMENQWICAQPWAQRARRRHMAGALALGGTPDLVLEKVIV